MEQQSGEASQITLAGSFLAPGGYADCYILDWAYPSRYGEYDEDNEAQIVMPDDAAYQSRRAGVAVDVTLPAEGEIPVYVEHVGERPIRILVSVDNWIEIGARPPAVLSSQPDHGAIGRYGDEQRTRTDLLGYVSATGRAFLITEGDFLGVCHDYVDRDNSQITVDAEGEDKPAFHCGVYVGITSEQTEQEYPVYCVYEDDAPKQVYIDLTTITPPISLSAPIWVG